MKCLTRLVSQLGVAESFPLEHRSTVWLPVGDTVFAPADLLLRRCSCARLEDFPRKMPVDCCGFGINNVARKTWFDSEDEITAALLHAEKSKLLCELRAEFDSSEDVLRLQVHDNNLECATVMEAFIRRSVSWVNDHDNMLASGRVVSLELAAQGNFAHCA